MVENAEFVSVIHTTVATSKELAEKLQDSVAHARTVGVTRVSLDIVELQAMAAQLRITAALISGFLEENSQMLDRIATLVDRLPKE